MSTPLHKTKGLVLRTVKYGETSLVVTVFTELFGVQSYIVSGVRKSTKKGSGTANLFQPGALLDLVVYHSHAKSLHRIREFQWSVLYRELFASVPKHSVSSFMVELLHRCLRQPEPNPDLFEFVEDCLLHLDASSESVMANMPLFFAVHLAHFFGFRLVDERVEEGAWVDLREGRFVAAQPPHPDYLEPNDAQAVLQVVAGFDETDSYSRPKRVAAQPWAVGGFRFGVPQKELLQFFGDAEAEADERFCCC